MTEFLNRHLGEFFADGAGVHSYAGEPWTAQGPVLIVEADQADVSGHIQAVPVQRLPGAVGDVVAGAKQRRRRYFRFDQVFDGAQPFGEVIVCDLRGEGSRRKPGGFHGRDESLMPVREPWQGRVADEPDLAVTQLLQIGGGLNGAASFVESDLVES